MTGAGGYLAAVDKGSEQDLSRVVSMVKRRGKAADPPGDDGREEIVKRPGRINELSDAITANLIAEKPVPAPLFLRGGVPVKLAAGVKTTGIRRDDAMPSLVPLTAPMLWDIVESRVRIVAPFKTRDGRVDMRVVGCPPQAAQVIIARGLDCGFPPVRSVAYVPLLHADGAIVREGYDPRARAIVCPLDDFGPIPSEPTRAQAEEALQPLRAMLDGFRFVDSSDEATAIAAMFTAVLRPVLSTAPGFGFTAPVRGSGKSKLADVCAVLATGRPAAALAWPPKEEEAEKRLGAAILAGDPVLLLDNLETPLGSAALNSLLTQESVAIRPLGSSNLQRVEVAVLVLVTANNLCLRGDVTRRFLVCHIDPGMERPETQEFAFCPVAWARKHRVELVRALLTIAQWGRSVGQQRPPLGSFEDWSRRVRDPLIALGLADPCACLDTLHRDDPEREAAVEVLTEWRRAFGDRAVSVADAIVEAGRDGPLRGALDAVSGGPGGLNPRRLGKYLGRQRDRMFGSLVVRHRRDVIGNTGLWVVEDRRRTGEPEMDSATHGKASGYETVRG